MQKMNFFLIAVLCLTAVQAAKRQHHKDSASDTCAAQWKLYSNSHGTISRQNLVYEVTDNIISELAAKWINCDDIKMSYPLKRHFGYD